MSEQNQHDEFLHSLFKEVELKEELGITEKVMYQIQESQSPITTAYKPPISKLGWIAIICGLSGILLYTVLFESSFTFLISNYVIDLSGFFNQLKNSINLSFSIPKLPSLSVPFLAAILVFNVAGMYFMLSYWISRKT